MEHDNMRYIIYFFVGLMALFLAQSPVQGITVSGAIIVLQVDPGEPFKYEMNLSLNPDEAPANLLVNIFGMGQTLDGSNREIVTVEDSGPFTARPFLNVSPRNIYLLGGGYKTISVEGRLPKDVGSGARFAIVNLGGASLGNDTVGVALAIDVPVVIIINGTKQLKQGKITLLDGVAAADQKTAKVTMMFNNTGNCHFKTLAEVILKDNQGLVLANTTTTLGISSILPGAVRLSKINLETKQPLKAGTYRLEATVKLTDGIVVDKQTGVLKVV
jgi:hypothetical protein